MATLVMKFGGTSVGSAEAIQQVLNIVSQERPRWQRLVVVTSAIRGVTDSLVKLANTAASGHETGVHEQIEVLRQRHRSAAREFIDPAQHSDVIQQVDSRIDALLVELAATCREILAAQHADGRLRDATLGMGERLMARILAAIFRIHNLPAQELDASEFIITDSRHLNAQPQYQISRAKAQAIVTPLLEQNLIPVVTGYIGSTPEGVITTLGRGGSDYSATYLASLIDADEVWIWTDVDGVMSADPRQIKQARVMDSISYQEVSEFAHFGAKVLHPRAVEPLVTPRIPLRVCNTFNPAYPGTWINGQRPDGPQHMSAITSIQGILVFIPNNTHEAAENAAPMMALTHEILTRQFLQEAQPVITVDSHAGKLLCYVVPTTAGRTVMEESVQALQAAFQQRYSGGTWRVEPTAIVAAIGVVDIQQTVQVLNAVKSAKGDLLAMSHGSPQCLLLAVPPQHALRVMKSLHRMILSIQSQLQFAATDSYHPPIMSVPAARRKRNNRQRNRPSSPPNRTIPL